MAERRDEEPRVQLATRIPKSLHRDLKLHCVRADVSVMDFVVSALRGCVGGRVAQSSGANLGGHDARSRSGGT